MIEDAGDRLLLGVARITKKGAQEYFPTTSKYTDNYPLWSRAMTIDYPSQCVMLPYQEYLQEGLDPSNIVCRVPDSLYDRFSYVCEQMGDDEDVIALEALIGSVKSVLKEGKSKGDWKSASKWLDNILSEVWKGRGAYPGIGSVLRHLGATRGTIYQSQILGKLSATGKDPLEHVIRILEKEAKPEREFAKDLAPAIFAWSDYGENRKRFLEYLCSFELTKEQIDRVVNPALGRNSGIIAKPDEVRENPYLVCEQNEGTQESPPISFDQIDHGMLPLPNVAKVWGERETVSPNDKRRVRGLVVDLLKDASSEGDTFLSLNELVNKAMKRLPEERACEPNPELIKEQFPFYSGALSFDKDVANPLVALPRLRSYEQDIRKKITDLLQGALSASKIDWKTKLQSELGVAGKTHLDARIEAHAQNEKAEGLERLFTNQFSVLTGRAGTGKTTVAKILVQGIFEEEPRSSILLLAPTGKARIRLQKTTRKDAFTIHQFLFKHNWINPETFSCRESGGEEVQAETVIVDESSMVPLDSLGTLFRAIDFNSVTRLILIGDTNQLPPIGPGRPFVDIINWLKDKPERAPSLIYLSERARQEARESEALHLSDGYVSDYPSPNDDEILSAISLALESKKEYCKGDLEVFSWTSVSELYDLLKKKMSELLLLEPTKKDAYKDFNASLGIGTEGKNCESWQILSPVRMQRYGTRELNRTIQQKYKGGLITNARFRWDTPKPLGDEEIVFTDKIIQIKNSPRRGWQGSFVDGYVANGEVGYIKSTAKGKKRSGDFCDVLFSTQEGISYRYFRNSLNENLELAYAITVHKAQGSDFDIVFFIIPEKARTLSRELLYTGLTRFRKKLVLLVEKSASPLRVFRKVSQSETTFRNTNLFQPIMRPEGVSAYYPENLIHRTSSGELVRSKSEVIVANILIKLGLTPIYEEPLEVAPNNFRLPDFTIKFKGKTYYWEHLGMLSLPSYKEEWERKKRWYEDNHFMDSVITSQEWPNGSIDSKEIEEKAKSRILNA